MNKRNSCKDPLEILGCAKGYSRDELIKNIIRHKEFTPHLIEKINSLSNVVLRNQGTTMAKKLTKMAKEVLREAYRAKQFTRTEINNRGVLYGIIALKHKVIDLVLNYFHNRWPKCVICLYNENTQITGIMDEKGNISKAECPLEKVVNQISKNRSIIPYFEDIQFSGKKIFETLYETQNISERENPRYFKQMIPDKCFKLPGMRNGIEKKFTNKNKRLDDFL